MGVDLVIFDCDGVLVDSEMTANKWIAAQISAAGLPIDAIQSRKRFVGLSMGALRPKVLAENGVDIGEDFVVRWHAAIPDVFSSGVPAIPGIADVLEALKNRDIPFCVASSGTIDKMHLTLGSAGLLDDLQHLLFSASMVKRGKPAPDLFLHAANEMGFEPDACVVIEDSRFGAQAAAAAGMRCFGYVGDPLNDAKGLADHGATLFDSMQDLPDLIFSSLAD